MFPYSYKRNSASFSLESRFRNVSERVKTQYLNSYRAIVKLVSENQYEAPKNYSRLDWKKVLIELQCTAFIKLRNEISSGNISETKFDENTLLYLKYDTIKENERVDWHNLYLKSSQSN